MESDNEADDTIAIENSEEAIASELPDHEEAEEAENSDSSSQSSSDSLQNIALREELSNPVRSPDNTLSFGDDRAFVGSPTNFLGVEGANIDELSENTLSLENEDTFDTDKDFAVPSEEDSSLCVSLSNRVSHTRHPSDLSESEILKYPGQPHAVIGGKIFPFDMGDEDFFPEFELPHDDDPRTDAIVDDMIQSIPDDIDVIDSDLADIHEDFEIDEIDNAESTPSPHSNPENVQPTDFTASPELGDLSEVESISNPDPLLHALGPNVVDQEDIGLDDPDDSSIAETAPSNVQPG